MIHGSRSVRVAKIGALALAGECGWTRRLKAALRGAQKFRSISNDSSSFSPGFVFASLGYLDPSIRIGLPFLCSMSLCPEIFTDEILFNRQGSYTREKKRFSTTDFTDCHG